MKCPLVRCLATGDMHSTFSMYNAIVLRLSHAQMSRTQDVITTSLLVNSFIWKRMRTFSESYRLWSAMVAVLDMANGGWEWCIPLKDFKGILPNDCFSKEHDYLVGGFKHFFHNIWDNPSQLTFICFRGVGLNHQPIFCRVVADSPRCIFSLVTLQLVILW